MAEISACTLGRVDVGQGSLNTPPGFVLLPDLASILFGDEMLPLFTVKTKGLSGFFLASVEEESCKSPFILLALQLVSWCERVKVSSVADGEVGETSLLSAQSTILTAEDGSGKAIPCS